MKTFKLSIILLIAFSFSVKSQIVLEHTYQASYLWTCHVAGQDKFFINDNGVIKIYNADHSLYKSIDTYPPSGYTLNSIRVHDHLVNSDNAIEVSFTWGNGSIYDFRVIDENSQMINNISGCNAAWPTSVNGSFKYILSMSNGSFEVWSCPGTMQKAKQMSNDPASLGQSFPNPTTDFVTIPYQLPKNTNEGVIKLYSNNGSFIRSWKVDNTFNDLKLSLYSLPAGMYYYVLETKGNEAVTKSLVVQ